MISADPLLPGWLLAGLVVALAAAAAVAYRRGPWPLALLRLGAVAVVVLALANPVIIPDVVTREQSRLALVCDRSRSMARRDLPGQPARLDQARTALLAAARSAGPGFTVEWWSLDEVLTPGEPTTPAGDTAYDGLAAFAAHPPAAVILASDGAERGTRPPDEALAAAGVPVSCLAIGASDDAPDVAVRLDAPGQTAFPGQDLRLEAVIAASPAYRGRQAELTVSGDGLAERTQTIELAAELRLPIAVTVGEGAGTRSWTARVTPLPDEASDLDNASTCAVRVVDRRLAVIVAEGRPWWDTAAAVRAWRRDRQLGAVAQYRAGTRRLVTGPDPATAATAPDAAAIRSADLIVLGQEPERALDEAALAAIPEAVAGGAGLLLLCPNSRDPRIAALDPVLWSATAPGSVHASAVAGAPALAGDTPLHDLPTVLARPADSLRPGTAVLMGEAARPLIAVGRHGSGRVVVVNAEGLWRWSLGRGDDAGGRVWRQLARLAVRDPGGLSADRPRYRVGQTARLSAAGETLSATAPGGTARRIPLVDAAAALVLDAPGAWTIEGDGQRLVLPVEADVRELVETGRRDHRLARLAAVTGGTVALPAGAAELGARLKRRLDLAADAPRPVPLVPHWWWWTLAAAALLAGEWWLRRSRHGVV